MLVAFAIALMIVMPHALWLSHHWRQGSQQTLAKLDIHAAGDGWAKLRGLYSLAVEVLRFLGLWMVAMLGLFGASIWRRPAGTSCASCALWRRYALALLVLFVGMVIFGGVTNLKDRWLDPCLFMAPLAFFACASHLAEHPRLKLLPGVLAAVAVMILVLLIFRVLMSRWHGHPLNEPIRELAAVLRNHGYDGRASILTGDRVLGGDLRVQFPQAHVYVGSAPPDVGGNWLVIVKVEDEAQLQVLAESLRPMQAAPLPETAVLPYRYAYESVPPASYRFALLH